MATRHTLPYYAPAELLPAPLPTVAEILASRTRLSCPHETTVVRVREHFAVKYGPNVQLQEAENMLFVRESSSVPVPTVYAAFYDEENKINFIVQECIAGTAVNAVWDDLSADKRQKFGSQLRQHMEELRSIPSQGYYGGIWRQPTRDFLFEDAPHAPLTRPHTDSTISGPQETEEQWNDAMLRYLDSRVVTTAREQLPPLRHTYSLVFKGHKPVFTHANLFLGNVMLREDDTIVIIDWEHAGWYPSYWEYCRAMIMQGLATHWYVKPEPFTPRFKPSQESCSRDSNLCANLEEEFCD